MKLLVVCLGNICRSPTAEGLIRDRLEASHLRGRVVVDSAGTGDWHAGQPPDRRSVACAARHGVDIGGLRARQVEPEDFHAFDWILCADKANLRDVKQVAPARARAEVALLLEWAGLEPALREVPDPYAGDVNEFERVWALLERAADGVVERLSRQMGSAPFPLR
ncbi:low molecular weight protein-tyrosine-phosphatase [Lysobacter sp. A3-1-A15]|uniref:low molecular weight protein-tyrosine-phosphatase n=1 Tax=Novilysobacter viscosus TaxID=3098602 RepID=UPI002ED81528